LIQVTNLSTPSKYQIPFSLPVYSIQIKAQLEMKDNKFFNEANGVSIWIIPQSLSNVSPHLQELLSPDEIERSNRYFFYRDHTRFLNRRAMVRLILGNYLELHPKKIKFEYTKHGKPYIKGRSPIKFSISSSGEYACLAVSKVEVGIDIEKISPFENLEEVSKGIIPQSIYLDIKDPHERLIAFYKCWTRLEAVLKAKGTGFFHNRKERTGDYIQCENELFEMKTRKIIDVTLPVNYAAAVCLACNWETVHVRYWKPFSNFVQISVTEQVLNSFYITEDQVNSEKCYYDDTIQLDMFYQ